MPSVTAPWHTDTNAPSTQVAYGTTGGNVDVTAAQWLGPGHIWVRLTKDMPAPEGADSVNVRLERELWLSKAWATAFALFGYGDASAELAITAEEGGRSAESRETVVHAQSVVVTPSAPNLSGRSWEFPDNKQPLFFQRPSAAPGNVTVGVQIDCWAAAGGFIACGAAAELSTFIDGMTVEWLFP